MFWIFLAVMMVYYPRPTIIIGLLLLIAGVLTDDTPKTKERSISDKACSDPIGSPANSAEAKTARSIFERFKKDAETKKQPTI